MAEKLSLEQFAALEAWMEAYLKLASRKPGDDYADLVTNVYRCRQRAMVVLTGAKFPAKDKEDEARFRAELDAMLKSVSKTGRAAPIKPTTAPDAEDPYGVG